MNKVLVRLTGLILVVVAVGLIIRVIKIEDEKELIIFTDYVFILTIALISLMLGVGFLITKISEDDNKK